MLGVRLKRHMKLIPLFVNEHKQHIVRIDGSADNKATAGLCLSRYLTLGSYLRNRIETLRRFATYCDLQRDHRDRDHRLVLLYYIMRS